mmetsp:Transcript_36367/g.82190  ORF Transcript_36367/g.82190 Transcript_36367/m.82190 type:complete len:393 (+) Transcript_36367:53-1231(+)
MMSKLRLLLQEMGSFAGVAALLAKRHNMPACPESVNAGNADSANNSEARHPDRSTVAPGEALLVEARTVQHEVDGSTEDFLLLRSVMAGEIREMPRDRHHIEDVSVEAPGPEERLITFQVGLPSHDLRLGHAAVYRVLQPGEVSHVNKLREVMLPPHADVVVGDPHEGHVGHLWRSMVVILESGVRHYGQGPRLQCLVELESCWHASRWRNGPSCVLDVRYKGGFHQHVAVAVPDVPLVLARQGPRPDYLPGAHSLTAFVPVAHAREENFFSLVGSRDLNKLFAPQQRNGYARILPLLIISPTAIKYQNVVPHRPPPAQLKHGLKLTDVRLHHDREAPEVWSQVSKEVKGLHHTRLVVEVPGAVLLHVVPWYRNVNQAEVEVWIVGETLHEE